MNDQKSAWNDFRPYAYMIEHQRLDMPITQAKEAAFALDRSLKLKIMALRFSALIYAGLIIYSLWWIIEQTLVPKQFVYFGMIYLPFVCMYVPEKTIILRWKECSEYRRAERMANDFLDCKRTNPSLSVAEYGNMCLDEYRM